ncbi:MAG: 3-dehydroquinate synthase [Synechococcaceae cyanobacterium SM2_3_1]|nr:3-dehydroquinate synthase [Synechococcaceae cyanobacterium SM2_3_1]
MALTAIPVKLPTYSYDIIIAPDSLPHLGDHMAARNLEGRVLVVSHESIFQHYGKQVLSGLEAADFRPSVCLLPEGEPHKTLGSVSRIYDAALEAGLERASTMLALGGGVVGDMTGLAAATWLRGINFVQVPTSLLAMVDASIGGKTGVNHPQGKNLIGAFHQPRLVWIDPTVLSTLPEREWRAALAEVIKYGVIQAPDVFEFLEGLPQLQHCQDLPASDLHHLLVRAAECKAWVVQQDEREKGIRAILNYGHTLGHALESVTQYCRYLHGEAVAVGMVGAATLAEDLGWWSGAESERQRMLIQRSGLPIHWPSGTDWEAVKLSLQADKKVKAGRIRFILPRRIGQVEITDQVSEAQIQRVLARITA